MSRVKEYPPGSVIFFDSSEDTFLISGQLVAVPTYSGPPLVLSPSVDPVTGTRPPLAQPVQPGFATPLTPTNTSPVSGAPGARIINETLTDGLAISGGDDRLLSTKATAFTVNGTNWHFLMAVHSSDNARAQLVHTATGFTHPIEIRNLEFNIPADAKIAGIQVRVERSKV